MPIDDVLEIAAAGFELDEEPATVRRTVAAIARLLGAPTRREAHDLRSFVAQCLGVAATDAVEVSKRLRGLDAPLVRVEVARLLDGATGAVLRDDHGTAAPGFELVHGDVEEYVAAPDDLAAYLPAGDVFDFDAVLVISWSRGLPVIALHARRPDGDAARVGLAELYGRARGPHNFYRGRTLRAHPEELGIGLDPIEPVGVPRAEVVHPDAVWAEVDANIGGLARHGDALLAAGLGLARGLLIAGAPGVGKTALCRVIAGELPAGTTVILVDSGITPNAFAALYDAVGDLAPAAVVLDDIDLLAGSRRAGGAGPMLGGLLARLDGFRPPAPVITVATTNVTESLDPALLRPGRFDAIIEIGLPDAGARSRILHRYVDPIRELDLAAVVAATAGTSGADLREIVRRTVLEKGPALTAADLLEVARTGRWKPAAPSGQYL